MQGNKKGPSDDGTSPGAGAGERRHVNNGDDSRKTSDTSNDAIPSMSDNVSRFDNICGMDAFEILGVRDDASDEVIRSAYLKLALIYHPDKAKSLSRGGDYSCGSSSGRTPASRPSDTDVFNKINDAWTFLSDPKSRESLRISRMVAQKTQNFELNCEMVALAEFSFAGASFSKDCRCGGAYEFTREDLDDDINTFQCSSCSLYVSILT